MSRMSEETQGETVESGRLQGFWKIIRKVKAFLGQRYVWLSLTVGFLWMLSIPIIGTNFQAFLGGYTQEFAWIFQVTFFPFTLLSLIITDAAASGVWVMIYAFSFVISMFFCLGIAYIIHRLRIKKHVK